MGVPYEIPPQIVSTPNATPVVFDFDWPDRSVISKIIVVQLDGTMEQFTVALYNHSQVQDGEQVSDSVGPDVGRIPDDCFRVSPDIQANSSGKLMYFSDQATGGYGFVFFGQKSLTGRQGQRERKVYLKISPVGAAAKRFAVVIGGMKEVE